jgi:hypothetical protein
MYRWRYIEVMSADLQVHGVAPFKRIAAWATVDIPEFSLACGNSGVGMMTDIFMVGKGQNGIFRKFYAV